jgi:PAS domain S-box-containing protein
MVESVTDEIAVTDLSGNITEVNERVVQMFGFGSKDEVLGRSAFEFIAQRDCGRAAVNMRKTLKRGSVKDVEYTLVRADGSECPGEVRASVQKDTSAKPLGFIAVIRDITERKQAQEELQRSYERLQRAMEGTKQAFALTTEMRDPYTSGHQRRVTKLACAIASEMGVSKERIEAIDMAGSVHDIGKMYVPTEILCKPGKLTEVEFSLVKVHPQAGYDILRTVEFTGPIAQIVLQHHERMNGSGYPSSLSGEDILLEARILAVADVVEAMSSHRPYRPGNVVDKALLEIVQKRDVLYDRNVVDARVTVFTEKGYKFD